MILHVRIICLFVLIFARYFQLLGLKHVSDDEKTHKNPNLRVQASPIKTKTPETVNTPRAVVQKSPPLLELEGKKWRVVCEMLPGIEMTDSMLQIIRHDHSCLVAGEL